MVRALAELSLCRQFVVGFELLTHRAAEQRLTVPAARRFVSLATFLNHFTLGSLSALALARLRVPQGISVTSPVKIHLQVNCIYK